MIRGCYRSSLGLVARVGFLNTSSMTSSGEPESDGCERQETAKENGDMWNIYDDLRSLLCRAFPRMESLWDMVSKRLEMSQNSRGRRGEHCVETLFSLLCERQHLLLDLNCPRLYFRYFDLFSYGICSL
jgi:hypothetical protein